MKFLAFLFSLMFVSLPVWADSYGRVIHIEPIYGPIQYNERKVRVCNEEEYWVSREPRPGEAIVNGAIGAAIGNQFGSGKGNDAMTLLGFIAGVNSANSPSGYVDTRHTCGWEVIREPIRVIDHFIVTYERNGRAHTFKTYERYYVGQEIIINN